MSGNARRAENSVMVLPEPGGPHKTATEENKTDLTTCHIYKGNLWQHQHVMVFMSEFCLYLA